MPGSASRSDGSSTRCTGPTSATGSTSSPGCAAEGFRDPDLLLAGLLHDSSKGREVRLAHRVAWSLGERYGGAVLEACAWLPGSRAAFERLRDHAEASAMTGARGRLQRADG